jgi:hypothetical protein
MLIYIHKQLRGSHSWALLYGNSYLHLPDLAFFVFYWSACSHVIILATVVHTAQLFRTSSARWRHDCNATKTMISWGFRGCWDYLSGVKSVAYSVRQAAFWTSFNSPVGLHNKCIVCPRRNNLYTTLAWRSFWIIEWLIAERVRVCSKYLMSCFARLSSLMLILFAMIA